MNKKDKKRILYSIPVLLFLLLLLLLLVRCHPETNIAVLPQNGALENDGIDEAELQKMMDDSMIAISINARLCLRTQATQETYKLKTWPSTSGCFVSRSI